MAAGSVIADTVSYLPGQVQPLSALLQLLYHADALLVMEETFLTDLIQNVFTGMAEWRMPQVMPQCDRFRQIAIVRAICETSSVWVSRVR